MKRDFLTFLDLESAECYRLFEQARLLRTQRTAPTFSRALAGNSVALLFEKPSTRTRVSFEVAIAELGGYPVILSAGATQLSRGESVEDTAEVLSRYLHGLIVRTFDHQLLIRLARTASIPVINALSDTFHPCQALADYYTIWSRGFDLQRVHITYLGDGNNVCHSLMHGAALLGARLTVCTPAEYAPAAEVQRTAADLGAHITLVSDPNRAVAHADILYTDVWASMGQEEHAAHKRTVFAPYQLNARLLGLAPAHSLVMHCLPAHRGLEITNDVIDGSHSIVWEQAENRLHVQKALLLLLGGVIPGDIHARCTDAATDSSPCHSAIP